MTDKGETGLEIAVIGMSGKFPGARNLEEFWENLKNGVECISTFSREELKACGIREQFLENPNYVRAYGVVADKAYFDASFFGYSPREAETMDPLERLFHECAWEALEDAGYDPISYKNSIGMYAGSSDGFGWQIVKTIRNWQNQNADTGLHITENSLLLSTRISYKLNLKGPSITMFTACSTGLVAVHTACRALLTGECHTALAGAGAMLATEKGGYIYQEGMILAPDGHCRPFSAQANGTVYGDGIGVVVLKRLKHAAAERDTIKAVIKASAINNDGGDKASFTAPGKKRIADVIRTVLKLSRAVPRDVSYIETHGTATPLGDAIEIEALKEAFAEHTENDENAENNKAYCGIGSNKSNLGHLDVAAGIASFIKTVLALMHRLIPPTLHFETPNPAIDFINSPFYVNAVLSPWQGKYPLKAGVCSFGIGGTNSFILLEGVTPPLHKEAAAPANQQFPHLLLLSARTERALEQMTGNLAGFLKTNPRVDLADVAYTLQVGRRAFNHRKMLVCWTKDEALEILSSPLSSLTPLTPPYLNLHTSSAGKNKENTVYSAGEVNDMLAALRTAPGVVLHEQVKSKLEKIGDAWLHGAVIDWEQLYTNDYIYSHRDPRRIPLPTYPFERQYYWINPGALEIESLNPEAENLGPGKTSPLCVLIVGDQQQETMIKERLQQEGRQVVVVRTGLNEEFSKTPAGEYVFNPHQDHHYEALNRELTRLAEISTPNRDNKPDAPDALDARAAGSAKPGDGSKKSTETLYQRPALSSEYTAPRDEIEQALVNVWQKFFGIEKLGIHDDFFELGGDSLKAITMVTEIHRQLQVRIPITEIFNSTTISTWAQFLRKTGKSRYSAIEPIEKKEYYPMSSVQKRIYILQQLETGSTAYNTPLIFDLEGHLEKDRLEQVFGNLLVRHESLRTCFQSIENETVQRIIHNPVFQVDSYDLSDPEQTPQQKTEARIIEDFIRPFDLFRGPLIRVGLIKRSAGKHVLITDMHHIVTDGSSIGILVREFMALYPGQALPILPIQYKDYTQWQNSSDQRKTMKQQEAYWQEQFQGELPLLNLPTDYARPPVQRFEGDTIIFKIHQQETGALKQIALDQDVTLFMLLISLYYVLLAKICGQDDIIVGTPIAGRTHADLQHVIGMLVNTLALRNYPVGNKTFAEFLQEVKKNTLDAFENQDYLFEDLVENITLDIRRDVSRNPIFDTMFSLMNFQSQYEANLNIDIPGLSLAVRQQERKISLFDLSLHGIEAEQCLWFTLEFCTHLFNRETGQRFTRYFKKIISTVVESPDINISQIPIIPEAEKNRILYEFNNTGVESIFNKTTGETVHRLFALQVEKCPDRIALVYDREQLTYKQLNQNSLLLAEILRSKGILSCLVVGVLLERSLEMITAILAVLKTGGAYLPIDSEYPGDRIDYMLADSSVRILITTRALSQPGEQGKGITFNYKNYNGETIFLDDIPGSAVSPGTGMNGEYLPKNNLPLSFLFNPGLVYIMYTSGSTGRPKGIMIEHRNVMNLIQYQYTCTSIDFSRVLQFTTISFDVSFQEIFSTLLCGGVLLLISNQVRKHIPGLFRVIEENQIKTLFLPASLLKFIFSEPQFGSTFPGCVADIVTAGEQLVVTEAFKNYLKTRNVTLHNHYGPTETHVVTAMIMKPGDEIPVLPPIGKPMTNIYIYIVNKELILQPIGTAGEIFIGGNQVGRGYLNKPELTLEKFIFATKPQSHKDVYFSRCPGDLVAKIYKTGDLGRWLVDGEIEFLGRMDTQVKIRGFRVELGEIENQLLSHNAVEDAVVMERKNPTFADDQYLCAYLVIRGKIENPPGSTELKDFLAQRLPEYMVPTYFIVLERIPLTPNGKVDRNVLPEPGIEPGKDYTPPRNAEEERLAEIWANVLRIEKSLISIDADFFQLGGHSLKANIMLGRIRQQFDVEFSLSEIFKTPTIRGISSLIKAIHWSTVDDPQTEINRDNREIEEIIL